MPLDEASTDGLEGDSNEVALVEFLKKCTQKVSQLINYLYIKTNSKE